MRRLLFTAALLTLSAPAFATDFQNECADNMLKLLGHGKSISSMAGFRPVVMVRCACLDRQGGEDGRAAMRFIWDVGTWDKAKAESKVNSTEFRKEMAAASLKLESAGAACDAEN